MSLSTVIVDIDGRLRLLGILHLPIVTVHVFARDFVSPAFFVLAALLFGRRLDYFSNHFGEFANREIGRAHV